MAKHLDMVMSQRYVSPTQLGGLHDLQLMFDDIFSENETNIQKGLEYFGNSILSV